MLDKPRLALDSREGFIWYDGKMVPWQQATVHVLTHGLHYATSVFEGIRSYGGNIFKLREHTARLLKSAELIHLKVPFSQDDIDKACHDVLQINNLSNAYLRPVAWSGSHELGIAARRNPTHLAIACWEWPSYFSTEQQLNGISLHTSSWRRPGQETSPVQSKCATHYVLSVLSKHQAEDNDCDDALMLDYRGLVAEATGANIFFIRDGQIHTPRTECALNGITRRTIMEIAKKQNVKVVERHIHPSELGEFSEVFITGTAAEVTLVNRIDDITYARGQIATTMHRLYNETVGNSVS